MHMIEAAAKLHPGTAWNFVNGKVVQAEDGTPRVNPPTTEQLQAALDAVAYQDLRRSEYPPIADQLDAIWKGGISEEEMLNKIHEIKQKYPKPGGDE